MENQIPDFKKFSDVWERVESHSEIEDKMQPEPVRKAEKPIHKRAVRFLPKF